MSTKHAEDERTEEKQAKQKLHEVGLLELVVGDNVLHALGKPSGLYRVQSRSVYGDSYRVNVFVGPDISSFKVAHSYFLKADADGKILASSPAITKLY